MISKCRKFFVFCNGTIQCDDLCVFAPKYQQFLWHVFIKYCQFPLEIVIFIFQSSKLPSYLLTNDKILSFGQLIPQFHWEVRGLINHQADMHQLFVDHDWQNRTTREQFIQLCCCITPQLVLSILLGLWPLESGTSDIVARGWVRNPTLFLQSRVRIYPPK